MNLSNDLMYANQSMRQLCLILCFFISGNTLCQDPLNLDSLILQLDKQADDTSKVATLLYLTKGFKQSDTYQARSYCNQLYKLSLKLNYLPGIIDALTEKTEIYIRSAENDSALIVCKEAIRLSDSTNDLVRLANNYRNFGAIIYRTQGPMQANRYFAKSYKLSESSADSIGMSHALNGIAVMLAEQSKYDSAVYYYLKLIKICEKNNYENVLVKGYINLGTVYDEMDEDDKAAYYFTESIRISKKLNKLIFLCQSYQNMGNIIYERADYDSAIILYNKAIELCKKINYQMGLGDAYIGLGNISVEYKEYVSANTYYNLSKDYYQAAQYPFGLLTAYKNMGYVQQQLGNYGQALIIYDSCLLLAEEMGALFRIGEIYFNIYQTYQLKGDYKKAYEFLLISNRIQDSINNLDKNKAIADLEIKYEKEKYLADNLALKNDNLAIDLSLKKRTNQRNIYMFSGSGIISILIFTLVFFQHRSRKNKIIADQKFKQLDKEKKLLAARFLVEGQEQERKRISEELHDGLGVLLSSAKIHFTTVRDKSPENRPLIDKAAKLLEQASKDVRRISHNMMPGLLTKYGLYEAVGDLIEDVNEMEGINSSMTIIGKPQRMEENIEIMLYRIIQEMVNNTLKHAAAKNIDIRMDINPDELQINYSDDGKGFDVNKEKQNKSIGLNSIYSRVDFLNGKIGLISSAGNGVDCLIKVPLNQKEDLIIA